MKKILPLVMILAVICAVFIYKIPKTPSSENSGPGIKTGHINDYLFIYAPEDSPFISLSLIIENDKIMAVGEKINEINELAYMNGYNWEIFLDYYLGKYHPSVLKGMTPDSEAGAYVAVYDNTPENFARLNQLSAIIENMVENETELYEIIRREGDRLEWD